MAHLTFAVLVATLLVACGTSADEATHEYRDGDAVKLYANKMGPFNNPLETYAFFELPGCPPASWDHKSPSLGQALVGDEHYEMDIPVHFRQPSSATERRALLAARAAAKTGAVDKPPPTVAPVVVDDTAASTQALVCTFHPTAKDTARWRSMVAEQYWYELDVDGLPVWASFGRVIDGTPHLYTHQHFSFGYNGDKIVVANLTAETPVPIRDGMPPVDFTYSVEWVESPVAFDDRFKRFLDEAFFEHSIHWFAIVNSFMMVLFLSMVVVVILSRTLKADYARFAREREDQERKGAVGVEEWVDETGWRQLHGDVFRVPQQPELLCVLVGQGWQLLVAIAVNILLAAVGAFYSSPGAHATWFVVAAVATAFVGGYVSGSQFHEYCMLLPSLASRRPSFTLACAFGFFGVVLVSGFTLNWVAVAYDSAQAIPFGGMVVMVLIWTLASAPLTVVGTAVGRSRVAAAAAQSGKTLPHVNQIPRVIPRRSSWLSPVKLALYGGLIAFTTIFVELYYVLTSFWNYRFYYVYGFLFLIFVMLLLVAACASVVVMYMLLNGEDHKWQWIAFGTGASTGIYVFIESWFFYMTRTRMSGFFMFTFYFGYTSLMCCGIALVCGAVTFSAGKFFVTAIYRQLRLRE